MSHEMGSPGHVAVEGSDIDPRAWAKILNVIWITELSLYVEFFVAYFWNWESHPVIGVAIMVLIFIMVVYLLRRVIASSDSGEDGGTYHRANTPQRVPMLDGYRNSQTTH